MYVTYDNSPERLIEQLGKHGTGGKRLGRR